MPPSNMMRERPVSLPRGTSADAPDNAGAVGTGVVVLVAVAAALEVASTNLLQPLSPLIATAFRISLPRAAGIGTAVQLGYVLGVLLAVPLGNLVERRRLIMTLLMLSAGTLIAVALSPSTVLLRIACSCAGFAASVMYVLIPYPASLVPPQRRGRSIGQIMTGALLAVPIAWVGAGAIGAGFGWRAAYLLDAALLVGIALPIARLLSPDLQSRGSVRARPGLLRSMPRMLVEPAALRARSVYCFLNVASIIIFWTGLPILLANPPHALGPAAIGLFGLCAVPGALLATTVGRLTARGHERVLTWLFPLTFALTRIALVFVVGSLPGLVVATVVVAIVQTGAQVTNQSVVSALSDENRSRYTAIYIFSGLIGAATGAAMAQLGWRGLCGIGLSLCRVTHLPRPVTSRPAGQLAPQSKVGEAADKCSVRRHRPRSPSGCF